MTETDIVACLGMAVSFAGLTSLYAYSRGWDEGEKVGEALARSMGLAKALSDAFTTLAIRSPTKPWTAPRITGAISDLKCAMAIAGVRGQVVVLLEGDDLVAVAEAIEKSLGTDKPDPVIGGDQRLYKNPSRGVQFDGISFNPIWKRS
jgi:hypothetical protein